MNGRKAAPPAFALDEIVNLVKGLTKPLNDNVAVMQGGVQVLTDALNAAQVRNKELATEVDRLQKEIGDLRAKSVETSKLQAEIDLKRVELDARAKARGEVMGVGRDILKQVIVEIGRARQSGPTLMPAGPFGDAPAGETPTPMQAAAAALVSKLSRGTLAALIADASPETLERVRVEAGPHLLHDLAMLALESEPVSTPEPETKEVVRP